MARKWSNADVRWLEDNLAILTELLDCLFGAGLYAEQMAIRLTSPQARELAGTLHDELDKADALAQRLHTRLKRARSANRNRKHR